MVICCILRLAAYAAAAAAIRRTKKGTSVREAEADAADVATTDPLSHASGRTRVELRDEGRGTGHLGGCEGLPWPATGTAATVARCHMRSRRVRVFVVVVAAGTDG
jgi:hypothetical protein